MVQLDAHTDLRQEYMGTKFNHACALAEAQKYTNLLQVGIRSMDCLLYTSDAADERSSVNLVGRRIIKKKHTNIQAEYTTT